MTDLKIKNVENKEGRYTREYYRREMFKEVTTSYNHTTKNLEIYLQKRILEAKDITKVFKNLEKQGYTVTTVETCLGGEHHIPIFNTEIGGIFNGNIRVINVLWGKPNLVQVDMGFKQTIHAILK